MGMKISGPNTPQIYPQYLKPIARSFLKAWIDRISQSSVWRILTYRAPSRFSHLYSLEANVGDGGLCRIVNCHHRCFDAIPFCSALQIRSGILPSEDLF
jgi:hypothetical protein